jgi:hypothetical protein
MARYNEPLIQALARQNPRVIPQLQPRSKFLEQFLAGQNNKEIRTPTEGALRLGANAIAQYSEHQRQEKNREVLEAEQARKDAVFTGMADNLEQQWASPEALGNSLGEDDMGGDPTGVEGQMSGEKGLALAMLRSGDMGPQGLQAAMTLMGQDRASTMAQEKASRDRMNGLDDFETKAAITARHAKQQKPQTAKDADKRLRYVGGDNHGSLVFPNLPEGVASSIDPNKDMYIDNKTQEQILTRKGVLKAEKGFRVEVKPMLDTLTSVRTAVSKVYAGLKGRNGVGDIAAINAYQRLIDPAVVRSDDVRLLQSANDLMSKLELFKDNAKKGDVLSDKLRLEVSNMAKTLLSAGSDGPMESLLGRLDIAEANKGIRRSQIVAKRVLDFIKKPIQIPTYLKTVEELQAEAAGK